MKLKGLLKSFFILGLTLSPIFFVNASEVINNSVYVEDIPSSFVIGNYTYSVSRNLNFSTDSSGNFIEWKNTPSYNQFYHFFGWINNKLYYVSYDIQQVQGYLQGNQGFIDGFCSTSDLSVFCDNFNISADSFYSMNKNITKIAVGNFYGNDSYDPFGLCFYNSLDSLYYCAFGSWSTTYSPLTGSLNFSSESDIRDFNWGSSPIVNEYPPSYLADDYTNQDVMLAWSRLGYNLTLCYSNFPITDLFNMSGSIYQIYDDYLEDGMGAGTGATVIDLYNQVNLLSFESFMSQVVNNTRTMLNNNFIPNYFNGRPVGLGAIGSKIIDHLVYYSDVFNYTDYYQYCNFALGLSSSDPGWDDNYNGPALPPDVEDYLGTEKNIRICSQTGMESSAFCGGFSLGGGGGGGGSRVASISDFYNGGFAILHSLDGVSGPEKGILPEYIVVAFIGFVLLYVLKR